MSQSQPRPVGNAERQASWRARNRQLGRVETKVWPHPEDRDRVRRYVERLNRQRESS